MGKYDHLLDTTGLYCPEPVMLLHTKIKQVAVGETLLVIATDPATKRDIPNFCRFLNHELLSSSAESASYCYLIRKNAAQNS